MAAEDQDQRTEEATGKRLEDAREEGRLPISREVANWTLFVGVMIVITGLLPDLCRNMANALRPFLENAHQVDLQGKGLQKAFGNVLSGIGIPMIEIFAVLVFSTVVGTMVQTGFYLNDAKLKPDLSRLSPLNGFSQLFSINALAEFLKSFFKLVVMGYVLYRLFIPVVESAPNYVGEDIITTMGRMRDQAIHILIVLMCVLTLIAISDLVYQRFEYYKSLRMTKQEVKDERKQMEGDPIIRGRLRQIRMEKARRRMMAKVPKADVVITNPTHFAVALQYDNQKMPAPMLVAKGADKVAARIREVAEENDVPIVQNPPLARALFDTVELDQIISPEHYRAVAEVISYVYKVKKKKGKG